MREKFKKIYDLLDNRFYFKLFYLFVSFTVVTIFKCVPKFNLLTKVSLLWAILILLFTVINDYKKRKVYKFDIPLVLFVGVTFVLNIALYRDSNNLKIWIINLILFGAIFTIDVFKNKKILLKEMKITTYFYVIFMFFMSLISLGMKMLDKTITIGEHIFGATKGGLFENENAISIAAAIAVLMCLYLKYISKNIKESIFLIINIVIQIMTMITFKGRSSYLIIIAAIYTFIFILNKNKYIRGTLIGIPLIALCIISFNLQGEKIRNFTSGRTSLWHCGRLVMQDHPLSGVGNSDMIPSVSVKSLNQDLPGIEYGGLHNIYVQIGTVNGIIALSLFLLFLGMILFVIVQHIDKLRRKEKIQMTYILSIITGILAVNLFESTLVYIISFISLTFWIYLGYIVSILDNKKIE